jgi:alkanesulfonate monooxygenase SsuD/methylene tetrahydromethanopterin reductase-like flavin-dependent oxidoreductase (luciferase family)
MTSTCTGSTSRPHRSGRCACPGDAGPGRPGAIAEFIEPTIAAARRPTPRIIAAAPVSVTDDRQALAADGLAFYDTIPSYQKVVGREGLASAVELAVVGSPDKVISRLGEYRDAGATDIVLSPLDHDNPVALQALWSVAAPL